MVRDQTVWADSSHLGAASAMLVEKTVTLVGDGETTTFTIPVRGRAEWLGVEVRCPWARTSPTIRYDDGRNLLTLDFEAPPAMQGRDVVLGFQYRADGDADPPATPETVAAGDRTLADWLGTPAAERERNPPRPSNPDVLADAVTLDDLGDLNDYIRADDIDPRSLAYAWTLAWLSRALDASRGHCAQTPVRQLAGSLEHVNDPSRWTAAERLLAAAERHGDAERTLSVTVAYSFTRLCATVDHDETPPSDAADDAGASDTDDDDRDHENDHIPMSQFDITDYVETTTATETTTETASVPTTVDGDGEVVAETEQTVTVEERVEVVTGGCQREGCREDHLPVAGAVPIVAGATADGRAREVRAWCPFCAESVYGAAAVEGETDQLLPESAVADESTDRLVERWAWVPWGWLAACGRAAVVLLAWVLGLGAAAAAGVTGWPMVLVSVGFAWAALSFMYA